MQKKTSLPFPWLAALNEKAVISLIKANCPHEGAHVLVDVDGSYSLLEGKKDIEALAGIDSRISQQYSNLLDRLEQLGPGELRPQDVVVVFGKGTNVRRNERDEPMLACVVHPRKNRGNEIINLSVTDVELRYRLSL